MNKLFCTAVLAALAACAAAAATTNTPAADRPARKPSVDRFDTNRDGRISLEEFYPAGPPPLHPRMKKVFESFDKEGRGSLSYEDTAKVIATVSGVRLKLAPEVTGGLGPIRLEVHPQSKRAVVKATVNGVEGRFLVDTGTSDTIVDTEWARQAGIDFVEACTHIVSGNYGKKGDTISFVRVPAMDIAGTQFRDFHAVFRKEDKARKDFPERLAGVIGANILFARPVSIDYRQSLITFPTNPAAGPHTFAFDLAKDHGKTVALNTEVDGAKVVMMLDSGALIGDTILVNQHYHEALRQLAGDPKAGQYRSREVRVGGQLFLADQLCLLRDFEETVIGSLFFDRHVITVDTKAGKLWLQRHPAK